LASAFSCSKALVLTGAQLVACMAWEGSSTLHSEVGARDRLSAWFSLKTDYPEDFTQLGLNS
jgi:hypothetical protein